MLLSSRIVRCRVTLGAPFKSTPLSDARTSQAIESVRGNTTRFEFGFFDPQGAQLDLSDVQSINLKLQPSQTVDSVLADHTITTFDNTVTAPTWTDGSKSHAVFTLSNAEMNIPTAGEKRNLWLVLTAITTGGAEVTLAGGDFFLHEDNNGSLAAPLENPGAYLTLDQGDARYGPPGSTPPINGTVTPTGNLVIYCAKYPSLNGVWALAQQSGGKNTYLHPAGNGSGSIWWDTYTGGGQTTPCFSLMCQDVCSLWSPFGQDVATPDLCTGDWTEWYPGSGAVKIQVTAELVSSDNDGIAQVETAAIYAPAGVTSSTTKTVIVDANRSEWRTYSVPLVLGVHTSATLIATEIKNCMNADPVLTAKWSVGGTGAQIILTKLPPFEPNDGSFNIYIQGGNGITQVATSTNTTAGKGPRTAAPPYFRVSAGTLFVQENGVWKKSTLSAI